MRLAFSGSANVGKSTLFEAFLRRWPMYSTPIKTYRDVIKENNLQHSSNSNEETQLMILNWMMEEQTKFPQGSKVVYDRCPWDNLAYTLHGNSKGKISDEVAAASISFVKESMKGLDIIFWLPFNNKIKVVDDGLRDANLDYIKEVDQIFSDLYHQYSDNLEQNLFYPAEDCPAIIPIDESWLTVDDRLFFVSQFIDKNGELIETEPGGSILDPQNAELMENMLEEQFKMQGEDEKILKILNNPGQKFTL